MSRTVNAKHVRDDYVRKTLNTISLSKVTRKMIFHKSAKESFVFDTALDLFYIPYPYRVGVY